MARDDFGHIGFTGLPNTRDLGGLVTGDGRHVRSHRLIRSGELARGSRDDIDRLRDEYDLKAVIDFRDTEELNEKPDPMGSFPDATYLHAPVLKDIAVGISQGKTARDIDLEILLKGDPARLMEMLYEHLLIDHSGIVGYGEFLQVILATEQGAVLWHCSMGRDRAGLGSMLVETLLGVPEDVIEQDYLATNNFYPNSSSDPFGASIRSLRAARASVMEKYGDFDTYFEDALGFTKVDREMLRDRYLVDIDNGDESIDAARTVAGVVPLEG